MSQRVLFSSIVGAGIAVLALFAVLRPEKPPALQHSPSVTPLASVISVVTPSATFLPTLPTPTPSPVTAISPLPPTSKPKPSAAPSPVSASTPLSSATPVSVSTPTPTPAPTSQPSPSATAGIAKPQTYTVLMEPDRFYPTTVTLRAGDTVRWVNKDIKVRWPASDPHPAHTNLPGFDAKVPLNPEETYAYTFMQTGTFSYHDHVDADILGEVIVTP